MRRRDWNVRVYKTSILNYFQNILKLGPYCVFFTRLCFKRYIRLLYADKVTHYRVKKHEQFLHISVRKYTCSYVFSCTGVYCSPFLSRSFSPNFSRNSGINEQSWTWVTVTLTPASYNVNERTYAVQLIYQLLVPSNRLIFEIF